MARVLITGALGVVGKALTSELKRRGHEVYGVDLAHSERGALDYYCRADVANYGLMHDLADHKFEHVYHLAAEFGRVNGEEYPEALWRSNAVGTKNMLDLQTCYGYKLYLASSSEVYGEGPWDVEVLDEGVTDRCVLHHHNDYAMSKWVNEQQVRNHLRRNPHLHVSPLRFFNSYGPGEHYHPYRSVVCLFIYNALKGLPYTVYRGYSRAFMYIDDFIPTLANVCERFEPGGVYNIGGTDYRSVRELSDLILRHLGKDDRLVTLLPEEKHNVQNKRPDITKAREAFGHDPKVTLEEGVPRTLDWMKQLYQAG